MIAVTGRKKSGGISYDFCIENEDYRAIIEMKNRTVVEVNKHLSFYGKEIIAILR